MNPARTALCLLTVVALPAAAAPPPSVSYTWKSVQIVGGGFVDGFVFHPTAKDVLYARTDIGGAYRRDPQTHRWEPMLDWVPYADLNLMGVESIAVDPVGSRARSTWPAARTRRPRSPTARSCARPIRGGRSQRTNVPIKFGGNEAGRGNGERMAVDPNDGRVLFLGTRHAGLWKSTDGAVDLEQGGDLPRPTC